jgi:pimeloyl-ACP methyl ester carboxylesterase
MSETPSSATFPGNLGRITAPALIIWGADDDVIPPLEGKRLFTDLPNARLEIIEGAGHSPYVDAPDAVAQQIRTFLRDQVAPLER